MKRISRYVLNLILTVSLLVGAVASTPTKILAAPNKSDEMQVHFIDVGQGDSTLITCGGHSMLIDAGD
ncbi:MAG: MBL fold metallo-hydrolase, partial [Ruminococcus flavefaciens]|nr:MBL fold metallo-hydrolase [Ruminococcus flavefaciens]